MVNHAHTIGDDYTQHLRSQPGPSSLRPHSQGEQSLDRWLSSSPSTSQPAPTPRSRSLPRDQPSSSHQHWSHLRTGVAAASALKAAKVDREARRRNRRAAAAAASENNDGWVDSEGIGDFLPGSGKKRGWTIARKDGADTSKSDGQANHPQTGQGQGHMDSWTPLAHFWQESSTKTRKSDQATSLSNPSPHLGESGSIPSSTSAADVDSSLSRSGTSDMVDEPDSFIQHDPSRIPLGENPLAFTDTKDLLDSDSDSDSDSDEDKEAAHKATSSTSNLLSGEAVADSSLLTWFQRLTQGIPLRTIAPSALTKGVTKCVVAYFLASLFTYSPLLSNFMVHLLPTHELNDLVPFGNLHMIATVAVYFHPARTFGSMIEADIFAMAAFIFSMSLSLVSMLVAEKLHDLDHPILSNVISVFVFLAGGMSLVGYAKVKMGKPTFNTACSLIYVSTFTVVVKEGAIHLGQFETDKIWQVSLVIFAGTIVSNLVCFTVWPQSATTNLHNDVSRVLDAYSTLLKILTRTFLLEDPTNIHIRSSRVRGAILAHHSAYTSMQKNLGEARYEASFDSRMTGRVELMQELVSGLNRLGAHLQGLRSSCATQHEILEKLTQGDGMTDLSPSFKPFLSVIGPHMRSLVFTCSRTLHALEGATRHDVSVQAFDELEQDLTAAIHRFQHEQVAALKTMSTLEPKRGEDSVPVVNGPSEDDDDDDDDDSIVVVFFFAFNLEELAQELSCLVSLMRRLREKAEERKNQTWGQWLAASLGGRTRLPFGAANAPLPQSVTFPANQRHTPSTAHTPIAKDTAQRLSYKLWTLGEFFKQRDVKFAIKAGFGCAILAAPAFIAETRDIFVEYKGQWALVSFMVVLSPTVGQSNQMSVHRILGTIFGAVVAASVYWTFPDNNVVLPVLGAIFSIPCFQYIVGKPHLASSGRFVLLTFNLTCLYAYNLRKTNVEVESVAFERTVAVVVGVVWATILNHMLWPNEARRELANGISDLLFKLSWLYQCLVLAHSSSPDSHLQSSEMSLSSPSSSSSSTLESQPLLLPVSTSSTSHFQSLELHIQFQLVRLESLLAQTKHEPRLKGPFPISQYREYLKNCMDILDTLHSLRCIFSRRGWSRVREAGWMGRSGSGSGSGSSASKPRSRGMEMVMIEKERKDLNGNVLLFFHLLATSSTLKTPLPPYLPPAESSRKTLRDRLRGIKGTLRSSPSRRARAREDEVFFFDDGDDDGKEQKKKEKKISPSSTLPINPPPATPPPPTPATTTSADLILLHSYLLAMHDLISRLESLGQLSWEMFGVVGRGF